MKPDTNAFFLWSDQRYNDIHVDGIGHAEAIKGSNKANVNVFNFTAIGGYEDVIDCVRGKSYAFVDGELSTGPNTRTFITLKGGINGVLLKNLTLVGDCKYPWDISLGDHTIYNKRKLLNQKKIVMRGVRRANGKPIKILVLDSEVPDCDFPVKIYRLPKFLLRIWFWILN